MSLRKIALIALIVVMLLGTIVFYGCKAKPQEEVPVDTTIVEQPMPQVDTLATPAEAPAQAPATK
ncbi:MAG: hypothetical protein FJ041_00485 [Candidatus Cloacimonetes bacterium]|nr:hypothetical protein [Candidatus Cloacimonadota bacterium]